MVVDSQGARDLIAHIADDSAAQPSIDHVVPPRSPILSLLGLIAAFSACGARTSLDDSISSVGGASFGTPTYSFGGTSPTGSRSTDAAVSSGNATFSTGGTVPLGSRSSYVPTNAPGGTQPKRAVDPDGGRPSRSGIASTGGATSSSSSSVATGLRVGYVRCGEQECDLRETVCCINGSKRCTLIDDSYAICRGYNGVNPDQLRCDQTSDCENGQVCCNIACRISYAVLTCMAASDCVLKMPDHCTLRQACDPAAHNPGCLTGTCSGFDTDLGISVCEKVPREDDVESE